MPSYLMLSKLTERGRDRIKHDPNRILQVNLEIEDQGCSVVSQHALLGRYDFASGSLKLAVLRKQMSESLQKKADQLLIDTQYKELRSQLSKDLLAGLARPEYSKRYQAMNVDFYQAGRLPSGSTAMSILMGVMRSGFQNKDETLLAAALQEFKARAATQATYARYVGRYEDMLTQLREGK